MSHKNSDTRMAELYTERAAGKVHQIRYPGSYGWVGRLAYTATFQLESEYRVKPLTQEEAFHNLNNTERFVENRDYFDAGVEFGKSLNE